MKSLGRNSAKISGNATLQKKEKNQVQNEEHLTRKRPGSEMGPNSLCISSVKMCKPRAH